MERDKAKDDDLVNFSQDHELDYISGQYNNLTSAKLKNMKLNIKDHHDKSSSQSVTHKQVYDYLEHMKYTRKQ